MQTKGKFYIAMTGAATSDAYWVRHAQNWTTKPQDATFFDTSDEAEREAKHARDWASGEVDVRQATRDIVTAAEHTNHLIAQARRLHERVYQLIDARSAAGLSRDEATDPESIALVITSNGEDYGIDDEQVEEFVSHALHATESDFARHWVAVMFGQSAHA